MIGRTIGQNSLRAFYDSRGRARRFLECSAFGNWRAMGAFGGYLTLGVNRRASGSEINFGIRSNCTDQENDILYDEV